MINARRLRIPRLLAITAAAVMASAAAAFAEPPQISGNWVIQQSGLNGTSESKITITQSGNTFVGQNAVNGNGFTGTFVTDSQINGKWHGPGGAGWLTVYVSPSGHSLNGTWGYNGRAANGSFTGNKFLPPSPITAAGKWNVAVAGTPGGGMTGPMACTQSGPTVLCHVGDVTINGKFRTSDKVRATWTSPRGTGWFSFWFNGDNNSFNGQWGVGPDSTAPKGRVVAQRTLE